MFCLFDAELNDHYAWQRDINEIRIRSQYDDHPLYVQWSAHMMTKRTTIE